ncbi:uncharacterized protein LOC120664556 [Panicum virgatum]|uniref:Uncharacterized protein n=1 Tax=Panicum virgatum TaxID=38727 RepID=A0A8T0TZL2_PANVG|nr:uncharacterized protein LOC120664556 [Panicum virgatum]KAG2617361.1 hypothetical protein PVAP13_3NG180309 [Panicum virgatum]
MAASSISCCIGPPAPPKGAASAARWSSSGVPSSLRRAFAAAAACAVVGMADGGGGADMALALARDGAVASRSGDVAAAVGTPRAPPRWSDRRPCPAWRANSLENVVPENLPRASARRRFGSRLNGNLGGGPAGARTGLGVASFPVAAPWHGLLLPLTNFLVKFWNFEGGVDRAVSEKKCSRKYKGPSSFRFTFFTWRDRARAREAWGAYDCSLGVNVRAAVPLRELSCSTSVPRL